VGGYHQQEDYMKAKWITAAVAVGCLAILFGAGIAPVTAAPETIKIGTLFAVTGGASNLGAPEQKTIEMLVEAINAKGGFNGKKIEVFYKDTQSKNENAISFAKQLIEENKVLAIIGPTTSGESMGVKDLCEQNKTLLISCAAAETIVNPVAPHVFKTPQNDALAAMKIFEDMKAKKITVIGVLTANSGFGMGGKAQLEKYAPQYGITIAVKEEYKKDATDLSDVVTKVKAAAGVQAIVNWSIEPAQAIVIKNIRQLGMKQPIYQSHGFGNIKYVEAAGKEAAEGVIFPCGRLLAIDVLPDSNPQKKVLQGYKTAYEAKYKEDVSTFGGHANDALFILLEAIRIAGSTDPVKVRDAMEKVTNFPGTGGIFNFSATDHNGLKIDAFEMLTVKNGKFALYKK
jgi:branched-chain amino acid transport system substrate-binding protein